MGIYLTGVFLGALDTNVLGPALPLIAHSFRVDLSWTAWTVTAYTVAYVATTGLAGAVGDRHGRRRVFALGVAAFGVASLVAALAPSFWLFLVGRAIQGAGAGAVFPNAQAEGAAQFPPERRGTALGMFGAAYGLASIIGPNVGGALAQYLGWPSVFLVNVPATLVVLALALRLGESRGPARAMPDWAGGLSLSGLLASGLLVTVVPGAGRWACAGLAAVLALVFVSRQRRARVPFLDTAPLRDAGGVALMAGAALIGFGMSAAVFVPTLAQEKLGLSVLGSGVALMPAALSGAVLAGVGGVLADRVGPRGVLQAGLLAGVLGGVLLGWPHLTFPLFVLAMVALGLATAFTMGAPLNRLALALYREEEAGQALALVAVFRSVGLAAGPIVLAVAGGWRQFTGMFGTVALASLVGVLLFTLVPDVRPVASGRRARETAAV